MILTINKLEELCKTDEYLFSGSVNLKDRYYVFSFVNSEEMLYIVNEIKQITEESKIEVQTYAKDAKDIQQKSFNSEKFVGI